MKWRERARRLRVKRALGLLLPGNGLDLRDKGQDILVVAVPVPVGLLNQEHPSRRSTAEVVAYVGEAAKIRACHAARTRVGSSAIPPSERLRRGPWVSSAAT